MVTVVPDLVPALITLFAWVKVNQSIDASVSLLVIASILQGCWKG